MEIKNGEKKGRRNKMSNKMKGEEDENLLFNFGVVFEALICLKKKERKQRNEMNNNN